MTTLKRFLKHVRSIWPRFMVGGLLEDKGHSQMKNVNGSPASDLMAIPGIWKEEFAKSLVEENPFMEMLRAEDNLKGVPSHLLESSNAPAPSYVKMCVAPEQGSVKVTESIGFSKEPVNSTVIKHGNRVQSFNTQRAKQILSSTMSESKIWFYDPQADEPLTDDCEAAMRQMGPAAYLKWVCENYKVSVDVTPQNEYECERCARVAVRALSQYQGEKFIQ